MSLFNRRRVEPAKVEQRSTFTLRQLGALYGVAQGGSLGISSIDEALRNAADWACVKVKAQAIASLPVDTVRYEGLKRIPTPAPQVITKPSAIVPRRAWMFQAAASMFTDGNVFGLVMAVDGSMRPSLIELVAPQTCKDRKVVDGIPQVKIDEKVHRQFPHGDLWFVPGEFVLAGDPFGLSPVWYGSKSTATSLAAEAFGGEFFTEGAHPSGLITDIPGLDEPGARAVQEAFVAATRGSREPVVMSAGKYHPLQINPDDSQFLELMNFEVVQACRRHSVPPSMVYAMVTGQNVTYANVTQADLQFLKHTLSYPIDLFEDALSALLPAPRVVKFKRDAMLRADPKARWDVHKVRLDLQTTSINDVRALEDEPPFDDPKFDEPGIPGGAPAAPAEDDDTAPVTEGDAA